MLFNTFLKQIDSNLHAEYVLETFSDRTKKNNAAVKLEYSRPPETLVQNSEKSLLDQLFPRLSTLPADNEAVVFCRKRSIPQLAFDFLYFADDVKKIEHLSDRYRGKIQTQEPRLVLPFYDHRLELSGVTCRALRAESLRYLTIKIKEQAPLIFGMDRVDMKKPILVVEGPIDSLFLDNCIAVAGTAFGKVHELGLPDVTIIFDNQPRNAELVKLMSVAIDASAKVVIWPQKYENLKDINDMVMAGLDVKKITRQNTFQGLEAKLKFIGWKRC